MVSTRLLATCMFIFQMLAYMAVVLYAPSLALSAVTGLDIWIAIVAVGVLCTFYTAIGGIKAVMWTDVFQVMVMFAGMLACLIQGSIIHGGFDNIWKIAQAGGRIEFDNFSFDPRTRHTWWSLLIGGSFTWFGIYAINQAQVQRILSCPNLRTGQIAMWLNILGLGALTIITILVGITVYATYAGCDPLLNKDINAADQVVPLFVMDWLSHIPGLAGLFVACVFSAALSTLSSGLNALSAVTLKDFLSVWCCPNMPEKRATLITKLIACLYGVITVALTVLPAEMPSVLTWTLILFGLVGAPLVSVFTQGLFIPWINWKGALCGMIGGSGVALWTAIGAQIRRTWLPSALPLSTDLCPVPNVTTVIPDVTTVLLTTTPAGLALSTTVAPTVERSGLDEWYAMSYLWYGPVGGITSLVIAVLVSAFTGFDHPDDLDPRLISPLFDYICCCLPGGVRRKLWCGVRHDEKTYLDEEDSAKAVEEIDRQFADINSEKSEMSKNSINSSYTGHVNPVFTGEQVLTPVLDHTDTSHESNDGELGNGDQSTVDNNIQETPVAEDDKAAPVSNEDDRQVVSEDDPSPPVEDDDEDLHLLDDLPEVSDDEKSIADDVPKSEDDHQILDTNSACNVDDHNDYGSTSNEPPTDVCY